MGNLVFVMLVMYYRVVLFCFVVFFFKQKTAYEMRISDWSSDVCSSDLVGLPRTGSTNLHGLMAQCEGIRAPRRWEMSRPSSTPTAETYETDPRIAEIHHAEVETASDDL